ncbi:MAG: hypothetical protein GC162_06785 [Planctomycetes bacterium]|nr:hypothetical protein [Planctomycetota bacterium]
MKTLAIAVVSSLALAAAAPASTVIPGFAASAQFDVNFPTGPVTQSGYTGLQDDGNGAGSNTFNATAPSGVKLTITNPNDQSRDRTGGGVLAGNPDASLLRDFTFTSTSSTVTTDALRADLTGLAPNTAYTVRVYTYDTQNDKAGSLWFAGASAPATLNSNDPALVGFYDNRLASPNSGFLDLNLTSDAAGAIHLYTRGSTGYAGNALAFLNGLSVTAIPALTDVIKADINNTNAGQGPTNVTKAGFSAINPVNNIGTLTSGSVTVTVTSDRTDNPTRNRNNSGDALFNDFILSNAEMRIDLSGLTLGKLYSLTIFSQDTSANSGVYTDWFLNNSTTPFKQGAFNLGAASTAQAAMGFTTYFAATQTNMTIFGRSGAPGSFVFLNGLILQESVAFIPAPAALPAGLALLGALAFRRRK